jgi:hypothetical protein
VTFDSTKLNAFLKSDALIDTINEKIANKTSLGLTTAKYNCPSELSMASWDTSGTVIGTALYTPTSQTLVIKHSYGTSLNLLNAALLGTQTIIKSAIRPVFLPTLSVPAAVALGYKLITLTTQPNKVTSFQEGSTIIRTKDSSPVTKATLRVKLDSKTWLIEYSDDQTPVINTIYELSCGGTTEDIMISNIDSSAIATISFGSEFSKSVTNIYGLEFISVAIKM